MAGDAEFAEGARLAIAAGAVYEAVDFVDSIGRFLKYFGRQRELAALREALERELELEEEDGQIGKAGYLRMSGQGEALLAAGNAQGAEALFRALLARLQAGAAYDAAYDVAMTQHGLGLALAAQGQPTQALAAYQAARDGFTALAETNQDAKGSLGICYGDIAEVHLAQGDYAKAQEGYEATLPIFKEVNNLRNSGVTLSRLGTLAIKRGDLQVAAERYGEALRTFQQLNEPQTEAAMWHQLGRVFEEAKQWEQAEQHYREALKLHESLQDLPKIAATCNQLGMVAEGAKRPFDAERWYLRAIEIGQQIGDQQGVSKRLGNLANLYQQQQRWPEAEQYARQALAIVETLDLSAEPWKDYNRMVGILAATNRAAEARGWRLKAQDSFAQFAGAPYQLPSWAGQVVPAIVAAAQGNAQAQQAVADYLSRMDDSLAHFATAVRRILAGERDFAALRGDLDYIDAYMVRAILQGLA